MKMDHSTYNKFYLSISQNFNLFHWLAIIWETEVHTNYFAP